MEPAKFPRCSIFLIIEELIKYAAVSGQNGPGVGVLRRGHPEKRRCSGQRTFGCKPITFALGALLSFAHFPNLPDRKGIRSGPTEADIVTAHRYAEASREALARYDGKGNV